jgi:hypothetical protein
MLVLLAAILGATALGAALVMVLRPDAPQTHAPREPTALSVGLTPTGASFIVLADLPTPTHTATRLLLPTATVLVPSPTLTPSPTATPTLTPLPPPTDTATPRPTSTPILPTLTPTSPSPPTPVRFAAPPLIAPGDGVSFSEEDTIELVWGSVGALPPDVYYVITLAYPHGVATWYDETPWTQGTSWVMSEHRYLLELADGGRFTWSVQVRQYTGIGADGRPTGVPLGPESETRTLTWKRSSDGGGGGGRKTPEPPPP